MDIHANCSFCGAPVVRKKQSALANIKLHFCNIGCKAQYQKLAKPVDREWLEDHYIRQGLDCAQIGRMVNRDTKSVWNWLKDFGIPTRPRGGMIALRAWQKCHSPAHTGHHHSEAVKQKLREARKVHPNLPHLEGGVHYLKGKRGAETPNWKGGCTPERQAFYSSLEWKALVIAVWHRDNAICQRCRLDHRIINCENVKFAIHHIESFADKEKRADLDNLVLLCRQCHLWVHSRANINKELIK